MPDHDLPELVYANVVEITAGPYDVIVDFGFKSPEQTRKGSTEYQVVSRVAMSWSHAKTMLPIMAKLIAQYESQVGQIPAPGFDDQSKQ